MLELRQILFVHTLAFVVPVFTAIGPCSIYQNVPLNILFKNTTHLCNKISGYVTYKVIFFYHSFGSPDPFNCKKINFYEFEN